MTPEQFEWEQEKIEIAYIQGNATRGDYIKSMGALGFSVEACIKYLAEIDRIHQRHGCDPSRLTRR